MQSGTAGTVFFEEIRRGEKLLNAAYFSFGFQNFFFNRFQLQLFAELKFARFIRRGCRL